MFGTSPNLPRKMVSVQWSPSYGFLQWSAEKFLRQIARRLANAADRNPELKVKFLAPCNRSENVSVLLQARRD
jgi:hypothetical protein